MISQIRALCPSFANSLLINALLNHPMENHFIVHKIIMKLNFTGSCIIIALIKTISCMFIPLSILLDRFSEYYITCFGYSWVISLHNFNELFRPLSLSVLLIHVVLVVMCWSCSVIISCSWPVCYSFIWDSGTGTCYNDNFMTNYSCYRFERAPLAKKISHNWRIWIHRFPFGEKAVGL